MAALPAVSDAHCLWALWETQFLQSVSVEPRKRSPPDPQQGSFTQMLEALGEPEHRLVIGPYPRDFFSTREQCQAALEAAKAEVARQPLVEGSTARIVYECLPDTIDPRGPRRN